MEHRRSPLPIFAAFDLEFDRPLPPSWGSEKTTIERRQNEQQVNIIAASVVEFNSFAPRTRTFRSLAPLAMSTSKIMSFAHHLLTLHEQGYAIVSWGGSASDFRMLCGKLEAYPDLVRDLKRLCMSHVDIPIAILAQHGMMVGLESCAAACLSDKGSGKETPSKKLCELWQRGGADSLRVVRHVEDDAFVTARLYRFIVESQRVDPRTYTGFRKRVSMKSTIQPGDAWAAWETTRSDRTMVVPLPLSRGRPQDVAACKAIKRTFAWKPEPPFTVESCCVWADV